MINNWVARFKLKLSIIRQIELELFNIQKITYKRTTLYNNDNFQAIYTFDYEPIGIWMAHFQCNRIRDNLEGGAFLFV